MNYEFPEILHIDDVLWAIEGCENIYVAEKEGYNVINYRMLDEDTFPPVKVAGGSAKMRKEHSLRNALRRECRGLIFCAETGKILRRPFHKFFNVGERTETLPINVSLSLDHTILDKLDGSMIAPFILNGEVRYGTKMGVTDVAAPVEEFVKRNPKYDELSRKTIENECTPIFEWCSNKQKIVLDNKEDRLVLTACRRMLTGEYMPHDFLEQMGSEYGIEVVKSFDSNPSDIKEFSEYVKDLTDLEGFVVRFIDGHMVKLKCDWYIQIHKAKEKILYDRHVVRMILDSDLDDVKPHLQGNDLNKITDFENQFLSWFIDEVNRLNSLSSKYKDLGISRKDFALGDAQNMNSFEKSVIFSVWDKNDTEKVRAEMLKFIEKKLGSNSNYSEMQQMLFPNLEFN